MKEVNALWTGYDPEDLKNIEKFMRPLPMWILSAVALFCLILVGSGFFIAKVIAILIIILVIYAQARGSYLDVRINRLPKSRLLPDSEKLHVSQMKIFLGDESDLLVPQCDWRLLIPLSGWRRTARAIRWKEAGPDEWWFVVKRVDIMPGGAVFIVPAGKNIVAYELEDLLSILEQEDGNIFSHTRNIGRFLRTLPQRSA
ncbi:MAG: hypothetical protein KBC02_02560 [Candidatus Pacebacteria bacterium]|nr:hypothetical protein [Candidatus Paceibacterota bacterium]